MHIFSECILVVVYDAKIRIIKQITTSSIVGATNGSCCLWCKDKNNKANHNESRSDKNIIVVVVYDAKIRIIKQITTNTLVIVCNVRLLFMMQR